ncbi:MAG: DUF1566 domain-containing protein [Deltaproteobacteria bacterium]|nr:DUF1566 domain-containing protein [Deltaproteobacteria bacterium]
MIRRRRNSSEHLALIFMALYFSICSAIPAYAGELPASHGACVACEGTLSPQGRWCDNGNGTVTDMSTGLVWLKDANWGGLYPLQAGTASQVTAYDRASMVKAGNPTSLTDGSAAGDWWLPTVNQLKGLVAGTEAVSVSSTYYFTGIQSSDYYCLYWASTSDSPGYTYAACEVNLTNGRLGSDFKAKYHYVWPVRGGQ